MQHASKSTATDWRARSIRPSDGLILLGGAVREQSRTALEFLGIVAVALAVAWWLILPSPAVAATLTIAATLTGLQLSWQARKRGRFHGWTFRSAIACTIAVSNLAWLLLFYVNPFWCSVFAAVAWECLAYRPKRDERAAPWWSHERISSALVAAGALKAEGDRLPTIGYVGKGRTDTVGTWRTFRLPAGATWRQVRDRHVPLASALGQPEDRLHIEHDPEQPANVVTVAVLDQAGDVMDAPELPARTRFTDPLPLGSDRLGRPQFLRTVDPHGHGAWHSLFVGRTGSGKTRCARLLAAWALLDPSVPWFMVSGKDDPEDWQAAQGLAHRYATVRDLRDVLDTLLEVERVAEAQTILPRAERRAVQLVIDEWYLILTRAESEDKRLAEEFRRTISRLAASFRSRHVQIVMTFQRGTVTYIDADLRANLVQKAVGMTVNEKETRYVLDTVPMVLPRTAGEFLIAQDDAEPTLVAVPDLDDDDWAEVCARAARLRADEPYGPLLEHEPDPAAWPDDPEPEVTTDPITLAAWAALHQAGPLTATALWDSLPDDQRPSTPAVLGRQLARMDGVEPCWQGSTKLWRHVPHPLGAPGSPRWAMASGGMLPPDEHPEAPLGAVNGHRGHVPPVLKVLP